jgi:hypothetical protein
MRPVDDAHAAPAEFSIKTIAACDMGTQHGTYSNRQLTRVLSCPREV